MQHPQIGHALAKRPVTFRDGQVDSNVSTVSITVTPVNDIPVAASMNVSTTEDTALTLDLPAQAGDVEGSALTVSIVTGPQ